MLPHVVKALPLKSVSYNPARVSQHFTSAAQLTCFGSVTAGCARWSVPDAPGVYGAPRFHGARRMAGMPGTH